MPVSCRLYVILARAAPVAVIFRLGADYSERSASIGSTLVTRRAGR
jgi:hypothetical protein